MVEKRFNLLEKKGYDYCIGFVDNLTGNHLSDWDMMNLANELNKENEQLKQENERLCNFNLHMLLDEKNKEIEQLNDENEQLKQYKQAISDVLMDWSVKYLSANEFIIVHSIMKELNVGDIK